jgi:hypothetical protein
MWILEIRLTSNYTKIAESISSFKWQPLKEFTGRKKQACQAKNNGSGKYDDDVILFIDQNEKCVKGWMKKIAQQRVKLLQKDV